MLVSKTKKRESLIPLTRNELSSVNGGKSSNQFVSFLENILAMINNLIIEMQKESQKEMRYYD